MIRSQLLFSPVEPDPGLYLAPVQDVPDVSEGEVTGQPQMDDLPGVRVQLLHGPVQGQPALPLLRLLRWIVGGRPDRPGAPPPGERSASAAPAPCTTAAWRWRTAIPEACSPRGRSPAVGGPGRRSPGTAPPPGQRPGTGRRDSGTPAGRAVRTGLHPGGAMAVASFRVLLSIGPRDGTFVTGSERKIFGTRPGS